MKIKTYAPWIASLLLLATLFALIALTPVQAANPGPLAAPTPVAAVQRSAGPEFPVFWANRVLTASERSSCFEVPDYAVVDLHTIVDQTPVAGAPNTTTIKLQFSNDNASFVDGVTAVNANAADAADLQQFQLFGRWACVYATVSNSNPVTVTVMGVVK